MQHGESAAGAAQLDEYRIVRPLGDSADGGVFLAHDRALDRAVVLHFLPRDASGAAALLEGARALARVSHPSLSRIHRVGEGAERPFVVQSFERGGFLDALVTPVATRRVLDIGRALAGALAALHEAGIAHGEVRADRIAVSTADAPRLIGLRAARAGASAAAREKDVIALVDVLSRIADASLRASLADVGHALTAQQLLHALDALGRPSNAGDGQVDNPYRGLRSFEPQQAALFFGRQAEVADALARLRAEPWLLVAGPSGAGKSSLVRAGIVPAVAAGALGERTHWDVATTVPGARPLTALAVALAPIFAREAPALEAELRAKPATAGRLARARTDAGLLLIVDQLEEAMTLADAAERDAFFDVLSRFGALAPGVRTIATLRSDFLDRLTGFGALGRDLLRARRSFCRRCAETGCGWRSWDRRAREVSRWRRRRWSRRWRPRPGRTRAPTRCRCSRSSSPSCGPSAIANGASCRRRRSSGSAARPRRSRGTATWSSRCSTPTSDARLAGSCWCW